MPKYVLKRKYKEYLDPTAKDWYNSIFDTKAIRDWTTAWNLNPMTEKQERINTADSIEKVYRNRAKRYIQDRLERESNPNFVGPVIPLSIKTLPSTIKESIGIANRAEGDHPLDYNPLSTVMRTRNAHWPEKGWQEGRTITYPVDTLNNISPTNNDPNFVHYKLGGRKKAALGGLTGDYRNLFNQNVRAGALSTAISGLGRLGNYLAINSFNPKMQHTAVQAEQAEKAPTTYSINAQRNNLVRSIAQGTRDIENNTASSQVASARKNLLWNNGINAFNNLYEGKLNRETEMLRADAQIRQGARQRNTAALNTAVARDTAYNTNLINQSDLMKKQALGNLFTGLAGDSINTINQLGNSYYNLLNNQQQLNRDIATASLYFMANKNAGNLFIPDENGNIPFNGIYDNIYNNVSRAWKGKLGGYNSLIRR